MLVKELTTIKNLTNIDRSIIVNFLVFNKIIEITTKVQCK